MSAGAPSSTFWCKRLNKLASGTYAKQTPSSVRIASGLAPRERTQSLPVNLLIVRMRLTKELTATYVSRRFATLFCNDVLASKLLPPAVSGNGPALLHFPADASHAIRSLRNMTTQLLHEAAQVIPNQQLLINVVSRRVRQLGLGHRPLVEATPRSSLTDIALREIIAGKLTYESASEKPVNSTTA